MSQYDVGPGDHSDRPWEDPDKKVGPQARRRGVALPPWALLAILAGIIVLLCVGLVLLVRALRGGGEEGTPTAPAETTGPVLPGDVELTAAPTNAVSPTGVVSPTGGVLPTEAVLPTDTVVLPINTPLATVAPGEIEPGVVVVVTGTEGYGLNLRAEPGTEGEVVVNAPEGTTLTVVEGPEEADGYTWWLLRTAEDEEGWGADGWLALGTE